MKKALPKVLRFIIFLSAGLGVLYLVYRNLNNAYLEECAMKGIPNEQCSLLTKLWEDFMQVNPVWILMVLLAFMLSNVFRTYKWQMLVRPLGYELKFWNGFHAIMLGYFANLGLPRMGEIVRAVAVSKNEDIPLEKVIGTIVTDRIMDFVLLGTFMLLGIIVSFDKIWGFIEQNVHISLRPGYTLGIIVGGLIILLGIGYYTRKIWMQNAIVIKLRAKFIGLWQGITSIVDMESPVKFVLLSIGIWVMYFSMVLFCFYAYAPTSGLGAEAALVVFNFGALGMVAPFPGGMGSYHYMIIQGLSLYGVNEIDAFSYANINFFSVQIFCNILFGLIALVALPMIKSKEEDAQN